MGALFSMQHVCDFTASYAPGNETCSMCGQHIRKGSPQLTRYIPGMDHHVPAHYHVDHGLQVAGQVRCPKYMTKHGDIMPPRLHGTSKLLPEDAKDLMVRFGRVQAAWVARCLHDD